MIDIELTRGSAQYSDADTFFLFTVHSDFMARESGRLTMQGRCLLSASLIAVVALCGCGIRVDSEKQQAAAEAVFGAGGVLKVDESDLTITTVEELPQSGFIITSVDLNQTDAGDDELRALEGMHSVTYVGLHSTKVTDAGVEYLSSLKGLKELELSYTAVTDAGLRALSDLPDLRMIYLYDTAVTDEAIKEFKKKCSGCKIVR